MPNVTDNTFRTSVSEDLTTKLADLFRPLAHIYLLCHLVWCTRHATRSQFSINLEVWEYWGNSRARSAAGHQAIDGILTKQHAIFDNEQEETCCRIVVTSHQTLMTRHGPSELRAFRRDTKFWSDKQCRALDAIPDRQRERDLFQKFDIMWVDEAHVVKRADAYTSIVIQ